jgi:hypothetical protein
MLGGLFWLLRKFGIYFDTRTQGGEGMGGCNDGEGRGGGKRERRGGKKTQSEKSHMKGREKIKMVERKQI